MAAKYKAFAAQYGAAVPKAASDAAVQAAMTRSEEAPPVTTGVVTNVESGEAKVAKTGEAEPAVTPSAVAPGAAR
jgi:hypothetical protein